MSYHDREKIIDLLKAARNKFQQESVLYEIGYAFTKNGNIVDINTIPSEVLLDKLPYYKSLYITKLNKLCTE